MKTWGVSLALVAWLGAIWVVRSWDHVGESVERFKTTDCDDHHGPSTRMWCFSSDPVERGVQQTKLEALFKELETLKGDKWDSVVARDVDVFRKVAIVGNDRLINPRVLTVSGDDIPCREGGRVVKRPRTVVVEGDHVYLSTSTTPVKNKYQYADKWSCVALATIDSLK